MRGRKHDHLPLLLGITLLFAGCGLQTTQVSHPLQVSTQLSDTAHPLVAQYQISASADATAYVEFGTDTSYGRKTWSQAITAAGGPTTILVAGMRASQTYHMRAVVQGADGQIFADSDHLFLTGKIPDPTTVPVVSTNAPGTPSSGIELLNLVVPNGQLLTTVFDLKGQLIWYYSFEQSFGLAYSFRPMPNGNMLILAGTQHLREVDLTGKVVTEITATDLNQRLAAAAFAVQIAGFHHDAIALANGHVIVICEEVRTVSVGGINTSVRGDAVIDLDPKFQPVWVWSAFDHLDTNRHPMDQVDWTHSNALLYSPSDGALILSMRNQHWILKINYENGRGDGSVRWKLGRDGDFQLTNGTDQDWFFGQHFPNFAEGETGASPFRLALFDNRATNQDGTTCATTTGTCFSRALLLRVDESAMTASIEWEDRLGYYSLFGGSILAFKNGRSEFALSNPFGTSLGSLVMEVDRGTNVPVWQMQISSQLAYRAFRIPSLYPGVQW
jgi:arylsulfate sulfotransferase